LGNVSILRRRFDADPRLAHLDIIGVGGVYDGQGYKRMRSVGAMAVGIATALGRQGVDVFTSIEKDINSAW
jgi:dihydroorotate dehydrogenase (fumarate)